MGIFRECHDRGSCRIPGPVDHVRHAPESGDPAQQGHGHGTTSQTVEIRRSTRPFDAIEPCLQADDADDGKDKGTQKGRQRILRHTRSAGQADKGRTKPYFPSDRWSSHPIRALEIMGVPRLLSPRKRPRLKMIVAPRPGFPRRRTRSNADGRPSYIRQFIRKGRTFGSRAFARWAVLPWLAGRAPVETAHGFIVASRRQTDARLVNQIVTGGGDGEGLGLAAGRCDDDGRGSCPCRRRTPLLPHQAEPGRVELHDRAGAGAFRGIHAGLAAGRPT